MRLSSFELLRIIAMFFILFHHLLVYVLNYQNQIGSCFHFSLLIDSFLIIAVNSFVLLSGYWGIKIKLKGFLNLYLMCVFYNLIALIFACLVVKNAISYSDIIYAFFPFSHPFRLWFIQDYIFLYLLSPLLNVVSSISKKMFICILIFLSIVNIYFGFLWQGDINRNGANIMNFIYLYLIGRYIFLHCIDKYRNNRKIIISYVSLAVLVFVLSDLEYLLTSGKLHYGILFGYNNPIIIIESIAFFLMFRNLKLKNKVINYISVSSLSVYLLHENIYVSDYVYSTLSSALYSVALLDKFILLLLFSFVFFAFSVFFDKLRISFQKRIECHLETIIIKLYICILSPLFSRVRKYLN